MDYGSQYSSRWRFETLTQNGRNAMNDTLSKGKEISPPGPDHPITISPADGKDVKTNACKATRKARNGSEGLEPTARDTTTKNRGPTLTLPASKARVLPAQPAHCSHYKVTDQCVRSCCLTASRTHRTAGASRPMCLECNIQIFCVREKSFTLTCLTFLRETED